MAIERYVRVNNLNKVVTIRTGVSALPGEITTSEEVALGQIYNEQDNSFTDDLVQNALNSRITKLEELIKKGNIIGGDVSELQTELKSLYEGTHDTYLQEKTQEAIDLYNLELIEMGVL